MKALLTLLLAVIPLAAFAAEAGRVISEPGTYLVGDPEEKVDVAFKDQRIKVLRGKDGFSCPAYAGWLLYTDSTSVLWLYDGSNVIQRITLDADEIAFREIHDVHELSSEAPGAFLKAIPKR